MKQTKRDFFLPGDLVIDDDQNVYVFIQTMDSECIKILDPSDEFKRPEVTKKQIHFHPDFDPGMYIPGFEKWFVKDLRNKSVISRKL